MFIVSHFFRQVMLFTKMVKSQGHKVKNSCTTSKAFIQEKHVKRMKAQL